MRPPFFAGVTTALVTPFKHGEIDFGSLKRLLRFQLDGGIQGFVVAGSTGEAATLTVEERTQILGFVLSEVAGAVPVVMGAGTFNTRETSELVRLFERQRPAGFLIVTPYYNKPPQRGLAAHFATVASATSLPVIMYNVPGRTGVKLLPRTALQIANECQNIVGIKEAEGNVSVVRELVAGAREGFSILSGDDGTFLESMACGGHGVISVISHVVPRWCVEASRTKEGFAKLTAEITPLCDALFAESNPIPVKWALKDLGVIDSGEVRLPLVELDPLLHERVRRAVQGVPTHAKA